MPKNRSETALPLHAAVGRPRAMLPISPYMVLASAVFWLLILVLSYNAIKYIHVYMTLDDSDLNTECTHKFQTFEENLRIVENYKKADAGPYLRRLKPETRPENAVNKETPPELKTTPPLVTAISSEDFWDVQGLIRQVAETLRPKYPDIQLIIYDVGLYSKEAELIRKYCECQVRTFEKSAYPGHIDDEDVHAWRPIIIQKTLEEHGSVFWLNPTSRLRNVGDLIQLKYRGSRDFMLWETESFNPITAYTNPRMFEYLEEPRCTFYESGLVQVSAMVFYRTNLTWNGIIKPWLKCALNKDCIAPKQSRYSGCFHGRAPKTTGCHRYDQSALSIVMDRLLQFSVESDKFVVPRLTHEVQGDAPYFPEQPWTNGELVFVVLILIGVVSIICWLILKRRNVGKSSFLKR